MIPSMVNPQGVIVVRGVQTPYSCPVVSTMQLPIVCVPSCKCTEHWATLYVGLCIFSVSAPELHPHCACTQIGSPKKRRKKRFPNVVGYGVLSGRLVRNRMCYSCHQSRLFVLCCPSLFVCSEQGGSVFLSWTVWVDLPCAVFLWLSFSDSPVWIESPL